MIDVLYDLIGGRETVGAATESFYTKVFADETLRRFFKTTDMAQYGPVACSTKHVSFHAPRRKRVYTGKDTHAAHRRAREQGLNDGHFDRFVMHFREALSEVAVDADKLAKVIKLLESRRNAVLNP